MLRNKLSRSQDAYFHCFHCLMALRPPEALVVIMMSDFQFGHRTILSTYPALGDAETALQRKLQVLEPWLNQAAFVASDGISLAFSLTSNFDKSTAVIAFPGVNHAVASVGNPCGCLEFQTYVYDSLKVR